MTDKELKKLKKTELLELMLYLRRELDTVKKDNEELRRQLEAYTIGQKDMHSELLDAVKKANEKLDALCSAKNIEADCGDTGTEAEAEAEEENSEDAEESAETEKAE